MKEREYTEGPKALENFEELSRAILQAPKPNPKKKKKVSKPSSLLKPKNSDKD